jgi:ribosomal protein S1
MMNIPNNKTLSVGQIVRAQVSRVESYGAYCEFEGNRVLVLVPEIRWFPPVPDCRDVLKAGDFVDVLLLRKAGDFQFCGSIKQCSPQENPFTNGTLTVGTTHSAKVDTVIRDAVTAKPFAFMLELDAGPRGLLPCSRATANLKTGDQCVVFVSGLDTEKEQVELRLSSENDSRSAHLQ